MKSPFLKSLKTWRQILQAHKPLGWAQLSHQKTRLLVAVTGVAFSNILIFTQLGIRALLFDGVTLLPDNLKGDLFLVSAYAPTIDWGTFPIIHLYKANAVEGVASASPLYISTANWVNPEDLLPSNPSDEGSESGDGPPQITLFPNRVKVLALNPVAPVLDIPEVNQQLDQLNAPDVLLFDRLAQEKLGPVSGLFAETGEVITVMNNRRVRVVGLFSLGSNMFDNGHVVMSDWNYARRRGRDSLSRVNIASLTLDPGADLLTVQARLQAHLSKDVRVLTREEVAESEQNFQASLPNGKVLSFGAAMGFIVGIVIVYQVLYTDVSDHLPEYATLKAMGYSDRALLIVVLQEALILAVIGFIPGFITSYWVYGLLTQVTRIPLTMRADVAFQIFILTLVMCIVSGGIAMNKLRSADPADCFRG
ncbi:MAG: FtsX-like permease family protein [Leptolyngbyaceae cyanobacterium MO_188.B28]|nr:FtsX-like permease family protein [Leptolyngbyaceae cyanobacterium MO_188.B28]